MGFIVALHGASKIRQLCDADHFKAPLVGKLSTVIPSRHSSLFIVVHQFTKNGGRGQRCQVAKVLGAITTWVKDTWTVWNVLSVQ